MKLIQSSLAWAHKKTLEELITESLFVFRMKGGVSVLNHPHLIMGAFTNEHNKLKLSFIKLKTDTSGLYIAGDGEMDHGIIDDENCINSVDKTRTIAQYLVDTGRPDLCIIKDGLSKEEAITAMNEGKTLSHKYFTSDEYITMKDGEVVDEKGIVLTSFWKYQTAQVFDGDWKIIGV